MIEAMACGTPVVAYRCGSVPEVIDDGVTGFIVDNDDQAAEAIIRASALDRNLVRRRFDTRFSSEAMARRYVALYEKLCDGAAVYPSLVDLAATA
jgi:glycosyltransferase involved in cell wall biosynthesis